MTPNKLHLTSAATYPDSLFIALVHDILVSINGGLLMALLMAQIDWLNEERRTVSSAAS